MSTSGTIQEDWIGLRSQQYKKCIKMKKYSISFHIWHERLKCLDQICLSRLSESKCFEYTTNIGNTWQLFKIIDMETEIFDSYMTNIWQTYDDFLTIIWYDDYCQNSDVFSRLSESWDMYICKKFIANIWQL